MIYNTTKNVLNSKLCYDKWSNKFIDFDALQIYFSSIFIMKVIVRNLGQTVNVLFTSKYDKIDWENSFRVGETKFYGKCENMYLREREWMWNRKWNDLKHNL